MRSPLFLSLALCLWREDCEADVRLCAACEKQQSNSAAVESVAVSSDKNRMCYVIKASLWLGFRQRRRQMKRRNMFCSATSQPHPKTWFSCLIMKKRNIKCNAPDGMFYISFIPGLWTGITREHRPVENFCGKCWLEVLLRQKKMTRLIYSLLAEPIFFFFYVFAHCVIKPEVAILERLIFRLQRLVDVID